MCVFMTHFTSLDTKLHENRFMAAFFTATSTGSSIMLPRDWCSINIYCRGEWMNESHECIGPFLIPNSFVGGEVHSMLLVHFMCLGRFLKHSKVLHISIIHFWLFGPQNIKRNTAILSQLFVFSNYWSLTNSFRNLHPKH